ncbi:MAG: AAA family ATPase [Eggerthellaceae bacterium]|nr:AAA family ATPase [Eggerthellaceae bacterium]
MSVIKETVEGFGFIDKENEECLKTYLYEEANYDLEKIVAEVEEKVVGQRDQIRRIVEYFCLWIDRRQRIREGVDESELPRLSSIMLMGPTASGKTYILRTVCKAMGLPLTVVSSTTLTGTGWRGSSVESELLPVARTQEENPDAVQVVLFDEFDKMRIDRRTEREYGGFNAQPSMLKLLDGGIYHAHDENTRVSYDLDTSGVLFLFAGAFSGLGKRFVAPRLRKETYATGGTHDEAISAVAYSDDENLLRTQAKTIDLLHWGILSELTGRIGMIVPLPALTEEQLIDVVNNSRCSLQNRFAAVMPPRVDFRIDDDAAHLLAQRAIASNLGARALESEIVTYVSHAAQECRVNGEITQVTITAVNDELQVESASGEADKNNKKGESCEQ